MCQPHQVRSEFEIFEQIVISFSGTHWSPWNDCLCFSYRARGALDRIVEKPNFFTIFLEFVYGLVTPFALCRQSLQSVFANWALENFRCVKLGPGYFFGGKLGLWIFLPANWAPGKCWCGKLLAEYIQYQYINSTNIFSPIVYIFNTNIWNRRAQFSGVQFVGVQFATPNLPGPNLRGPICRGPISVR